MILLDTHMWYWWAGNFPRLTARHRELIEACQSEGLGLSVISCWEVAKKHYLGKLELSEPLDIWLPRALSLPGLLLLLVTPTIALESARLPDDFRSDPADELIVSTARVYDCALLTADAKILNYSHVKTLQ